MLNSLAQISLLDWLALLWLLLCWNGYAWYSERSSAACGGLFNIILGYRQEWAAALLRRDLRVADAALIGNLTSTVSFYANTTIYIIAGLFALLGTLDKVVNIAADLPFARQANASVIELKLMVLLAIFIFAYFKFTWSLRQFNLYTILVGAAPSPADQRPQAELDDYAHRLATVNAHAGDEFYRGIRAYYFGLATVTWMIHPWLFIAVTSGILLVLYRRDFSSDVCRALGKTPPGDN